MAVSSFRRLDHARPRRRDGRLGQSLPEFALTLPMVLLLVLFGVDFGRVFLGWVTLTNAVREGANFAAINPTAWGPETNLVAQAEYRRLMLAETADINCTLPSPMPAPSFPSGTGIGSPAVVAITCRFGVITPIVNLLVGNEVSVTASSAFPIRTGTIMGVPVASPSPSPSPAPSASVDPSATPDPGSSAAPSEAPTPTPDPGPSGGPAPTPGPTPAPTASPTPTPPPTCTVPNINGNSRNAVSQWTVAGFTAANLIFSPLVPPHYSVKYQSLTAYTVALCSSTMTVSP
jgi:TadE-like protein